MKNLFCLLFLLQVTWIYPPGHQERPRFPARGPMGHWLSANEAYQVYGFGQPQPWRGPTYTPWGTPAMGGKGSWRPINTPWGVQLQRFR